jgi:multiple sugar transport system permease protein
MKNPTQPAPLLAAVKGSATPTPKRRVDRREQLKLIILFAVMSLIGFAVVFPFIWMVLTSFKPENDIVKFPPQLFPEHLTLDAYADVWRRVPFGRFFLNSVLFAGGVTIISLVLDSLTAYALSRLRFPGRDVLFVLILIALMIPFQVTFIPLYVTVHDLGLTNTFGGLIIPRATNAFGIFLLRQFFSTLPRELDDAARVDGASEFYIYRRIVLPLSIPALTTLAIFHFMYNWNDFLWPLLITTSTEMRTLPAGLALFMGQHVVEYALLMAGGVLALAPLFIAFLFAQQYFVRGIALSGLKE